MPNPSTGPEPRPLNVPLPDEVGPDDSSRGGNVETGAGTGSYPVQEGLAEAPAAEGPPVPSDLIDHPRYEVLEQLGSGGMGTVYKARHRLMDRLVALKVINPHLVGRPAMVERFYREMRAAARLSHPNIVAAYDADRADYTFFLVMELVEGVNLDVVLGRNRRLPHGQACEYARQTALGLQHAFERGMVHRDVKPHNLMLTPGERIKILDFGLARFVSEVAPPVGPGGALPGLPDASATAPSQGAQKPDGPGLTSAYAALGTVDYMAPEEARDATHADIRADVYSLGCTLYRALAGQVPFPEGTVNEKLIGHLGHAPQPLRELRPDIPSELVHIVERMMAKRPGARYQTPAEVAQALAQFAAPAPLRILVVEDDALTRLAVVSVFEGLGYRVAEAADGREALDWLRRHKAPDLILLDLGMPVMTGWDLFSALRSDPALASIPVLVLSASDPSSARVAALGAAGYLQKPVDLEEVGAEVQHLTGRG